MVNAAIKLHLFHYNDPVPLLWRIRDSAAASNAEGIAERMGRTRFRA
jgi:hypothetical protein